MKSSAQLEREAEQTRSELASTLDELRGRITLGQLVDEGVDYAKDTTGGEFFRNLSRQMAGNPLPVVLIGAGISWLALAKGNSGAASGAASGFGRVADRAQVRAGAAARDTGEWSEQTGDMAKEMAGQAADMAGSLSESAKETAAQARSRMADAGSATSDAAASAYESMRSGATSAATTAGNAAADAYGRFADTTGRTGAAMAQSATDAGQKVAGIGAEALQFCKSQPLVLAGIGLALGAVLGAIMPPTEAEDRLMGDSSDRIKDQARGAAEEQMGKVKSAVDSGMEQAQTHAEHLAGSVGEAATSIVPEDDDATAKLPLE